MARNLTDMVNAGQLQTPMCGRPSGNIKSEVSSTGDFAYKIKKPT